ncbi:putative ion transporter superfamily protein YfcC [Christiangramia gaetbulicola]|uniref:Putative ion transporter superfamily protein YfcC n=1 Tax=Christiangramia gaetbulicola TaxID=703340 RepID=A0A2T6AI68_9FLAO|nr:YfcC family protein [Christiangramia gaetbulicola]PTX43491.1 putative ion transporter superfamily protein YfcC [Christiangramia gaetbulicola]
MKKISFPSAQAILLIIAAFVAVLTWIVPAGTYASLTYDSSEDVFLKKDGDKIEKLPATAQTLEMLKVKIPVENFTSGAIYKPISIPGTYKTVEAKPQGLIEFLQAPIKGIIETADIIFLVLIIGGTVGVVERSRAFNAGIQWLSEFLKGREYILIISTTALIALGGSTFGFGEETIAFLPILVPVFLAAKYDALVAIACVFLGSQVGVMASTTNPFSTIIASDAAGIVWTTGLYGRIAMFILCVGITIIFILKYARKVKADPGKSIIFDQKKNIEKLFAVDPDLKIPKLTPRLKIILLVFIICFVVMVYGVIALDFWFIEMTTVFFFGAIIIGFLARMKEDTFLNAFMNGAGDLLGVAFIIGLARGISILMSDGLISDTVLYTAGSFTEGMEKGVFINTLFVVYNFISFFVSSTSGTAVLTVPIIAPLADTVNIGREVIVNAYQFGHGLFNLINPTGLILAFLGIAKIGYDRFLKFIWPLLVILAIVIIVFLSVSV